MKSFGSKRKARVIKVDDPDEQENAPEAPVKEAEPTRKYLHPKLPFPAIECDADFRDPRLRRLTVFSNSSSTDTIIRKSNAQAVQAIRASKERQRRGGGGRR